MSRDEKLNQFSDLLFELIALYHQKLGGIFHLPEEELPKCTKNQKKSLLILYRSGMMTPTELGQNLDLKKGTLTALLDSLEASQLVYREPDHRDRRKIRLFLTGKGKTYVEDRMRLYHERFCRRFDAVSSQEVDEQLDHLQHIVKLLKEL